MLHEHRWIRSYKSKSSSSDLVIPSYKNSLRSQSTAAWAIFYRCYRGFFFCYNHPYFSSSLVTTNTTCTHSSCVKQILGISFQTDTHSVYMSNDCMYTSRFCPTHCSNWLRWRHFIYSAFPSDNENTSLAMQHWNQPVLFETINKAKNKTKCNNQQQEHNRQQQQCSDKFQIS